MADRYYRLKVAGVTRELPILNVTDTLAIAGFVMLGDVELVENCAREIAKKVPRETEIILTAETDQNVQVQLLKEGAVDCITKPFIAELMMQRLSRALS